MYVKNTHEPIVSYELFVKANSMLKQCEFKQSGKKGRNIYCCGYCGRKLQGNGSGVITCWQRYYLQKCDCRKARIKKENADNAVLEAVRQQVKLLVREKELSKEAKNRTVPYSEQEEMKILVKTIAAMKKTWMPLYEQYTDGKLSREDFLREKKKYDEEIDRLELRMRELQDSQTVRSESGQQKAKRISQLLCFADQIELTEEIKEKLIDKVKVFSDNRIEICWNFETDFFETNIIHECG